MQGEKYYIGVDGGATNVRAVIADSYGNILGFSKEVASTPFFSKEMKSSLHDVLKKVIYDLFTSIHKVNPLIESISLGMTGLGIKGQTETEIKKIINELIKANNIRVYSDMEIAYRGAALDKPGILIYAGTGANCYGLDNKGQVDNVSGWGYLIDDEGGGYFIGVKALRAVYRAYDERGGKTILTEKIKEYFQEDDLKKLCFKIYSEDDINRNRIGLIAPLVTDAAKTGDKISKNILNESGFALAECAAALYKKLSYKLPVDIYTVGGVFKAGNLIEKPFKKRIMYYIDSFQILKPVYPAVIGALLYAKNEKIQDIENSFLQNIDNTIEEM